MLRRGVHAGIAIIVVLSVSLAIVAGLGDLPDVEWRFRPVGLLLSAVGLSAFLIANAEIWRRLLRALGPEIDARQGMMIWFVSALGRYVPAGVLLVMLRAAMAERVGVPKRICLASVAYELALFFTAALLLGSYFVIDLPALQDAPQRFLVLVLPVLAIVAMQPRIFHTLVDRVLVRLGRARLPLSLPGGRVFEFVGLYAVTYVIAGVSLYALAQSVYPVGVDDLPLVVGAFAVGTALSLLAFVLPGGLVAREAGIALALSPVMPAAPAIAIAVLARIVQIGLEVLIAMLTPLLTRNREALRPDAEPRVSRSTASA
jgi:hypothetical protein